MRTALSIAGSDSCGGAGIQADIKTMTMNGVYAMTAVTALTAQNTTGVTGILEASPDFLGKQIEAVFDDIRPDAVKIGMVSSKGLIMEIVKQLRKYEAGNIVVDPVMVATSGARLIDEEAVATLKEELIPLAVLITPNIPEGEILSGMSIKTREDMMSATETMGKKYGCKVLLKGGHSVSDADDLLYECGTCDKPGSVDEHGTCDKSGSVDEHGTCDKPGRVDEHETCDKPGSGKFTWFEGKRIDNPNTHGTGCTLSSAIAAGLAKGLSVEDAIREAKEYISGALAAGLDLGKGSGPLNHAYRISE